LFAGALFAGALFAGALFAGALLVRDKLGEGDWERGLGSGG